MAIYNASHIHFKVSGTSATGSANTGTYDSAKRELKVTDLVMSNLFGKTASLVNIELDSLSATIGDITTRQRTGVTPEQPPGNLANKHAKGSAHAGGTKTATIKIL